MLMEGIWNGADVEHRPSTPQSHLDVVGSLRLWLRAPDHPRPDVVPSSLLGAAGKQFLFSDLGETELRGFEDPVKLWELRWHDG